MDRGAWQATVHGVAKSQTQLSNRARAMHKTLVGQRILYIEMRETQILSLFIQFRDHLKKSNHYLTLCTNSYVASNRGLWSLLYWLLNANICKCIFSKYGTSIEVGCHKATVTRKCLQEICDKFSTRELHISKTKQHR